jgi:hypothetical protein
MCLYFRIGHIFPFMKISCMFHYRVLSFSSFLELYIFVVLEFELRALHLLDRCSTTSAIHQSFLLGSCTYAWAILDNNPTIYTSLVAEITAVCHHTQAYWLRWGLAIFSQPWTTILSISASQLARIKGMSHSTDQEIYIFLLSFFKILPCFLFGNIGVWIPGLLLARDAPYLILL